jgi:2-amino-4-hydroxy-6-hydroxymethyldihydropteridine diphosphokinase
MNALEIHGVEVGIGLGSNVGDKAGFIRQAASLLVGSGLIGDLTLSSLYRTAPWGHVEQDWFVNACAWGHTTLPPAALLDRIKALEIEIGRTTTVRWGPRVIDIDILYYGDVEIDTPRLILPHKEILNRAFVLVPLAEIRPERRIGGVALGDAIARLGDQGVVPL